MSSPKQLSRSTQPPHAATVSVVDLTQTVAHLQAALASVLDESEAMRAQLLGDNAKLQREFRQTVDLLVAQQEQLAAQCDEHGAAVRRFDARFEGVEDTLAGMRHSKAAGPGSGGSDTTPQANAAALHQTKLFVQRADAEIATLRGELQDRIENVEKAQAEQAAALAQREAAFHRQLVAYKEEQQKMQMDHLQRITNVISSTEAAQASAGGGSSHQQLLHQVEPLVASEVRRQLGPAFRAHSQEVQQTVDVQVARVEQLQQNLSVCDELVAQQGAQLQSTAKELTELIKRGVSQASSQTHEAFTQQLQHCVASLQQEWGQKNAALMVEIDDFVREYCNGEFLDTLKEQFQAASSSSTFGNGGQQQQQQQNGAPAGSSPQQRPKRDGGLRDVVASSAFAALQEEVAAIRARVDHLTDDAVRLTGSVTQATHSCARVDQQLGMLRTRIDAELRSEFQRVEQLQGAHFQRQEQLLESERQNMTLKVSTEVQAMRMQLDEAVAKADKRRLDDVQSAREQLQNDFNRCTGVLREEVASTTKLLTEKVEKATASATDAATRTVTASVDSAKRSQVAALEELRRVVTRNTDELNRIKSVLDDNAERLQEQSNYLHVRLQQLLDEEAHRIDRLSDDISLRLNAQVETEVRRVVATNEGAAARGTDQRIDALQRDAKSMKEELVSLRSSLHSVAAPSTVIDALAKRLDVQRGDLQALQEQLNKHRAETPTLRDTLLSEVEELLVRYRNEVISDVATQLQRFDRALVEATREAHLRATSGLRQPVDLSRGSHLRPPPAEGTTMGDDDTSRSLLHLHSTIASRPATPGHGQGGAAASASSSRRYDARGPTAAAPVDDEGVLFEAGLAAGNAAAGLFPLAHRYPATSSRPAAHKPMSIPRATGVAVTPGTRGASRNLTPPPQPFGAAAGPMLSPRADADILVGAFTDPTSP